MQKIGHHLLFVFCCFILILLLTKIPFTALTQLASQSVFTHEEFAQIQQQLSSFVIRGEMMQVYADEDKEKKLQQYSVKLKLFNLFNITNLKVKLADEKMVLVGGSCVGISLKSKGVVVVGSNYILTQTGKENPFKDSGLQVGDVILKMNEQSINDMQDITDFLQTYEGSDHISLSVLRKNEPIALSIKPARDIQTKSYKLGLWIRDDAVGVGTMTYVNPSDDNYFGALGHAIMDADTGVQFEVNSGELYRCNVIGVKKGQRGTPGELLGLFLYGEQNKIGQVVKNCDNGVFGTATNESYLQELSEMELGGQLTAKPGKAKILTCLNGTEVKEYDIEIIKTNYQTKANNKSMVIKITDKDLLDKTGGIVQGMSGSPIIQNGKIVGAVTHVFVNDPTKGFGIYLDWMMKE